MRNRLLLLSLLLLGGCGQKGQLYLPAKPAPQPPAESAPAEAVPATDASADPATPSPAPQPE